MIYPATIYLATENPIAQIGITNLTGYRLSTAYSLGSGLCQDILRMQAGHGKTQGASNGDMKKWIIGYCNDLIDEIVGIGPLVTGGFCSRRMETAFLCLVICLPVKPLRCDPPKMNLAIVTTIARRQTENARCVPPNLMPGGTQRATDHQCQPTALALRRMQHAERAAPVRPHQHQRILTAWHAR